MINLHHEDALLMLPELLLGSLSASDDQAVRAHVDGCDRCQHELQQLDATFGALTSLLPSADPSPQLRARVLGAVDDALAAEEGVGAAAATTAGEHHQSPAANVVPIGSLAGGDSPARSRRRDARRMRPSFGWAPLVAAAACLALFVVSLAMLDRTSDLERSLDRANGRLAAMEAKDEDGPTTRTGTVLADATVPVQTTRGIAGSHGHLLTTREGSMAMLTLQDLPAPRAGRSWQIWAIDGSGQKRSIDVVSRGSSFVVVPVQLGGGKHRVVTVAITSEPEGGSSQPTGVPVAHASV